MGERKFSRTRTPSPTFCATKEAQSQDEAISYPDPSQFHQKYRGLWVRGKERESGRRQRARVRTFDFVCDTAAWAMQLNIFLPSILVISA